MENERPENYYSNGSYAGEADFINVNDGMSFKNAEREFNRNRDYARHEVAWALKEKILIRPEICSKCNKPPKKNAMIEAHHESYDQDNWLDVVWLCASCHRLLHGLRRTKPWFYD